MSVRAALARGAGAAGLVAAALAVAAPARAHQLNVFVSTDCEIVPVEARFSSGCVPVEGHVRVRDGKNAVVLTAPLQPDGTLRFPLAEVDASTGLLVEVSTANHEDDWILPPEDIARKCQS